MPRPNIPYARHEVTEGDIMAVEHALRSNFLTGGPELESFEQDFRTFVEAPFAVGVANGTAALQLSIAALGLKRGETVIVPSLTFAASANAALYAGGKVEFVDIDPATLLLDVDAVEEKLSKNPQKYAGVVGVDFAGYPLDAQRLADICHDKGAWLVEDAAHALGARFLGGGGKDVVVGGSKFADMTTFSFHPAKHITSGEGGMVTTSDPKLDAKLRKLRSHAMDRSPWVASDEPWRYDIAELGYNVRMSEISAALGRSQLSRINSNLARRSEIATTYDAAFADDDLIATPGYDQQHTHANHLYTVQVPNRLQVYNRLKSLGIFTQVHYTPLHMQPLYRQLAEQPTLPNTENYYKGCLSIPMFQTLRSSEQDYVISALKQVVRQ